MSSRRTHITLVLNALHWLPVQYRIQYKLLLLVFHSLHGSAPQYNCQLITRYNPSRCLRSSTSSLLVVPQTHNNLGDRAFSHAGLLLWNNLPLNIRNMSSIHKFKEALKTLFINFVVSSLRHEHHLWWIPAHYKCSYYLLLLL